MPEIALSPNIPNFIVRMDAREATDNPEGFNRELVQHYEAGDVIILDNAPLSANYGTLNRVSLPRGRAYQKLTDRFFRYPKVYRPQTAKLLFQTFNGNIGLYLAFRREVIKLSSQVRDYIPQLFFHYNFLKYNVSWRFTPTGPEGMHLDHFGSGADVQYVRLFINLDEQPRVWHLTQQLDDLAARYYESGNFAALREAGGNEFCRHMNPLAFKKKSFDYHIVKFHQGDVWLCDTRLVSHQIVSGHRMLGTHFVADPQSMQDPKQRLEHRVQGYHQLYGGNDRLSACAASDI